MCRLELYVPAKEDLRFRQELLEDPGTMNYNKGYDLNFPEYHNDTGCIDFPEKNWDGWYSRWINAEPGRFYAYLRRKEDGVFLGETCLHRGDREGWYEMGIVLQAKHRGRGYSAEGMALLLEKAFDSMGALGVSNRFERSRKAAWKLHLTAGFEPMKEENGVTLLELNRERYESLQGSENT